MEEKKFMINLKFLDDYLEGTVENLVLTMDNLGQVLFMAGTINKQLPIFLCNLKNGQIIPKERFKDNDWLVDLLCTYSNAVLKLNYKMLYSDGLYEKKELIDDIKEAYESSLLSPVVEVFRFKEDEKDNLLAYSFKEGEFVSFKSLFSNDKEKKVHTFLDEKEAFNTVDSLARIFIDLRNNEFLIYKENSYDIADYDYKLRDEEYISYLEKIEESEEDEFCFFSDFRELYEVELIKDFDIEADDDLEAYDKKVNVKIEELVEYVCYKNPSSLLILDENEEIDIDDYILDSLYLDDSKSPRIKQTYLDDYEENETVEEANCILKKYPKEIISLCLLLTKISDKKLKVSDLIDLFIKINSYKQYHILLNVANFDFNEINDELVYHFNYNSNIFNIDAPYNIYYYDSFEECRDLEYKIDCKKCDIEYVKSMIGKLLDDFDNFYDSIFYDLSKNSFALLSTDSEIIYLNDYLEDTVILHELRTIMNLKILKDLKIVPEDYVYEELSYDISEEDIDDEDYEVPLQVIRDDFEDEYNDKSCDLDKSPYSDCPYEINSKDECDIFNYKDDFSSKSLFARMKAFLKK